MTPAGCVFKLEITRADGGETAGELQHVELALDDRQIRSLARDLQRTANRRGISLWDERKPDRFPFDTSVTRRILGLSGN